MTKPAEIPGRAKILIIEDDPDIQEMLSLAFRNEGWKLVQARTGEDGLVILAGGKIDCIILDIMLPGIDGFGVLKKIRSQAPAKNIPVILATARGEETDIVTGLELGADDYITKPYSPKVLCARIRVALRRAEDEPSREIYRQGDICLDTIRHEASRGEIPLELSATEFALLKQFLSHPEMVFSRSQIITAVHGTDYPVTDRSVDVQILSLRRKLGKAGSQIETIRGVGYRFKTQWN